MDDEQPRFKAERLGDTAKALSMFAEKQARFAEGFGKLEPPKVTGVDIGGLMSDVTRRQAEERRQFHDATLATAEFLGALVEEAREAEARENRMLRWTIAGVVLAAVAAAASVVGIIVAFLL